MLLRSLTRDPSPRVAPAPPSPVFMACSCPTDLRRAERVHRRWVELMGCEVRGFDVRAWRHAYEMGELDFQRMIDWSLAHSETTVVLFDERTYGDEWVEYQIEVSLERNNYLLAVDVTPAPASCAVSPFAAWDLHLEVPTFHWEHDDGERALAHWVDAAVRAHDLL